MDYSDDLCLYTFTEGQIIRAKSQVETYRLGVGGGGGGGGGREDLVLADGVLSEGISLFEGEMQHFSLEVAANSRVTCVTSGDNGDAGRFVRT